MCSKHKSDPIYMCNPGHSRFHLSGCADRVTPNSLPLTLPQNRSSQLIISHVLLSRSDQLPRGSAERSSCFSGGGGHWSLWVLSPLLGIAYSCWVAPALLLDAKLHLKSCLPCDSPQGLIIWPDFLFPTHPYWCTLSQEIFQSLKEIDSEKWV